MKFDNLFDFETKKITKLLSILHLAHKPCLIDNLAQEMGLNRKTLMKYIEKLQKLFEKYKFGDSLKIDRISRNELALYKESDADVMKFTIDYMLNAIEVKILTLSLESDLISFEEMAVRVGVSESLLRNRIRKLSQWLTKYQLKLERKSYKLVGEESQVREFLYQFYQFFPSGVGQQKRKLHGETLELAEKLQSFFELSANEIQKTRIQELINVTVDRFKRGDLIQIKGNWQEYFLKSPLYDDFSCKMACDSPFKSELAYLFLMIQVRFSSLCSKIKQAQVIQDHFVRKTSCFNYTQCVVERIKYYFIGYDIKYEAPVLLSYLNFHLYYELVQGFSFEAAPDSEELYVLHPKFMANLEKVVMDIQKNIVFFASIEKKVLICRYFHILTAVISPLDNENKKYICLLTELSPETELEVAQQLKHFFYNKLNLHVFYGRKSQSFLYADVILVSSICQKIIEKTKQPLFLMESPQLKLEELLQIEKMLK